jgi:hypothetical protein
LASIRPALAIRSGASSRIGIYSPDVGDALGFRLALAPIRPALATRSGAAPYAVNFSSLLHHRWCSVCYVDFSSTYFGSTTTSPNNKYSTMTSPTTSTRQHPHDDSATMRLHRPRHARTSFGVPTHDIQDYNIEARLESLPDSTNRLDTRGLLTRV